MTTENTDFALKNENTDFELINKNVEEWVKTQFWEKDPMQSEPALCDIILWVDWEQKTANVETVMKTNSIPGELYHGLASSFTLPGDTDFEQFLAWYKENVQPKLQALGETYTSEWDGSNWIGSVDREAEEELYDYIRREVPEHDMYAYFSLRDSYEYGGMQQLKNDLEAEGIDILTADLDDEGVMSLAVEIVTYGDGGEYKLIDVDVERELRIIQEELIEEAEEEN